MKYYAGLDVSLEETSICVVDGDGVIVAETKVASEPRAIGEALRAMGLVFERAGLEAGPAPGRSAPSAPRKTRRTDEMCAKSGVRKRTVFRTG